jgi:hypothetical protein
MRVMVLGTFLVDGVAAVWLIASLAFGEGRITAFDAMIVSALLLGFFTSLAVIIETREEEAKMPDDATDAVN